MTAVDERADELGLERLQELRLELGRAPSGSAAKTPALPDFAARRSQIAAKVARAERGYVDGVLDGEALRRERTRLDEELGRLEVAAGAAARSARAVDPAQRRAALADVAMLAAAWGAAPVDVRRAALSVLARSIVVHATEVEIAWRTVDELCQTNGSAHLFSTPDDMLPTMPRKRGRR